MKHQENIAEVEMDEQLGNLFASMGKQRAPADFTQHLMKKIEQEKVSELIYKPVISKAAWVVIGFAFVAILLAAIFLFPESASVPAGLQKLTGIFGLKLSEGGLFHFQNRLLQFLSGSHVLPSVLAVAVVMGWYYLFMQSRSNGSRNRFPGMLFF